MKYWAFIYLALTTSGETSHYQTVSSVVIERCLAAVRMANIDRERTGTTKLELTRGGRKLAEALAAVAGTFKLPLSVVNVHLVGRSDSDSFQDKKVPTINLHSLTNETFPILHTVRDQMTAIRMAEYYDSYRLITAYLAYLDQVLDPAGPAIL